MENGSTVIRNAIFYFDIVCNPIRLDLILTFELMVCLVIIAVST